MIVEVKPEHHALLAAMRAPIGVEGRDIDAPIILAIAAQLVGQLIAVQDQSRWTREACMDLVCRNIEIGNREAVSSMLDQRPG